MSLLKNTLRQFNRTSRAYSSEGNLLHLPKAYTPDIEKQVLHEWDKTAEFEFENNSEVGNVFSMILPPPNVTGTLHLGHALTVTVQDTLARWHRLKGDRIVWVPGSDHAGIATQAVVEKSLLASKKMTRHDLGRTKFVKEVWKWKSKNANRIKGQLKSMGTSLDWSHEYFTLDKVRSDAVSRALVNLWNSDLIYRGDTIVNWSCQLGSTISDLEVDHVQVTEPTPLTFAGRSDPVTFGQLFEFAYKVVDSNEEIIVSTTRPETMLGDVAVAVHPTDARFAKFVGLFVHHPFTNEALPVICDDSVDPSFGTGAVKVTPSHDPLDYEIAKKHGLPFRSIINEKGIVVNSTGQFSGLDRFEARKKVLGNLANLGLLRDIKPHAMSVPFCSRSGDVLEFLIKPQWFLKTKDMASRAAAFVRRGDLTIIPEKHQQSWFSWLDHIKDWCISRQLWWGHQLPFYLCKSEDDELWVCAMNEEEASVKAEEKLSQITSIERDCDVLDTWFSSGLLPFSSHGWPEKTNDYQSNYPLSLMVTGHDILFFWVARMVMLGDQLTGKLPFRNVLLHSVICDHNGRKMSKSKGNVIDPVDVVEGASLEKLREKVQQSASNGIISERESQISQLELQKSYPNGIQKCGTDALRFTFLAHNLKQHNINFDVKECLANKLFCNKIWQAVKFTQKWTDTFGLSGSQLRVPVKTESNVMDRWILSQLSAMVGDVTRSMESFDFHLAASSLRHFLYGELCDVYIEAVKTDLKRGRTKESVNHCLVLNYCLDVSLRCLSPFMPFITDVLYKELGIRQYDSLKSASIPKIKQKEDKNLNEKMRVTLKVIESIRRLKNENQISRETQAIITTSMHDIKEFLPTIETLSRTKCRVGSFDSENEAGYAKETLDCNVVVLVRLNVLGKRELSHGDIDILLKKRKKIETQLEKLLNTISTDGYRNKVSDSVKTSHRAKIEKLRDDLDQLNNVLIK